MGNESLGPFNNSFESKFTTRNCEITLIFSRLILGPERLKSCIFPKTKWIRNYKLPLKFYKYIFLKITCVLWSNLKIDKNWSPKWQTPKNVYFNYVSTWITLKIYLLKGIRKPQLKSIFGQIRVCIGLGLLSCIRYALQNAYNHLGLVCCQKIWVH